MNIGKTIKQLRKDRGYSQITFGERCEISQSALSLIENGTRMPNKTTFRRICEVLEVPEELIYFLSIDESTIAQDKKEKFNTLYPWAKDLMMKIFLEDSNK
ncbi:helix-turn-helix transcriptional regulator [Fluviicola taffensis]|uniref:helix-turn-helix domain-containing protein n=1 Tax=Fluviicola taffensis TaxID=191579 RepID=UPI0031383D76